MSLRQYKTFSYPLYKVGTDYDNPQIVEVGDTIHLVQRDRTMVTVTAAEVLEGPSGLGQRIGWDISSGQPRSQDIIAAGGVHQFVCPFAGYDYDTYDTPPDEPDYSDPNPDLGPPTGDTMNA